MAWTTWSDSLRPPDPARSTRRESRRLPVGSLGGCGVDAAALALRFSPSLRTDATRVIGRRAVTHVGLMDRPSRAFGPTGPPRAASLSLQSTLWICLCRFAI